MQSIGILGGSFNPPHIAHLRLALEVREQLALTRMELVPAATPPHKHGRNLLPFAVRSHILREAVRDLDGMLVNDLESRRKGLSYSYDTLQEYRKIHPKTRLFFIMGSEDLVHFAAWYKACELPGLAHLVLVCRGGLDRNGSDDLIRSIWPERRMTASGWTLPQGLHDIFFLEMNRLDISSSMIREKWMRGQSIRYLVPETVERYLDEHRDEVARIWSAGNP